MSEPPDAGGHARRRPVLDPTDPLISADYVGWWQRTTAVVDASWRQLVVLQVSGAAVSFLVGAGIIAIQARTLSGPPDTVDVPSADLVAAVGLNLAATAADLAVYAAVALATVHLVINTATSGRPTVVECLRAAVRRFLPLTGWSLLASLLFVAGLLAAVLPGIYLAAVLLVLAPVVALERTNPIARCFRLFHGDLAASTARAATLLALIFPSVVVDFAILGPADPVEGTAAAVGGLAVSTAVTAALGILLDPLTVTAYADLRARIEPLTSTTLADQATALRPTTPTHRHEQPTPPA